MVHEPPNASRRLLGGLWLPEFTGPPGALFDVRPVAFIPAWAVVLGVAGGFVATVLLTHAEYVAHGTCFGYAGPAFNMLINPIYEEVIFRGWILGRLARYYRANLPAIAVSSVLFGLLHLRNIYWLEPERLVGVMLYTGLILGPVLAWVTLRCRSVWPAVVLHYLNNLTYYLR